MRVAVETGGTIEADPGETLDRPELEELLDKLAEALVQCSEFEADISFDYGTREVGFFVVVEASGPREAFVKAEEVITRALDAAGILQMSWTGESHTRRADLVSA